MSRGRFSLEEVSRMKDMCESGEYTARQIASEFETSDSVIYRKSRQLGWNAKFLRKKKAKGYKCEKSALPSGYREAEADMSIIDDIRSKLSESIGEKVYIKFGCPRESVRNYDTTKGVVEGVFKSIFTVKDESGLYKSFSYKDIYIAAKNNFIFKIGGVTWN